MSIYDGNINDIGNDTSAADGEKAKEVLSKLDPMDAQTAADGQRLAENLKKLLEKERDPQSVEDGQRLFAMLKKLVGMAPASSDVVVPAPATADAVVDTGVLTGPRPDLKSFLIKKQRDNEK